IACNICVSAAGLSCRSLSWRSHYVFLSMHLHASGSVRNPLFAHSLPTHSTQSFHSFTHSCNHSLSNSFTHPFLSFHSFTSPFTSLHFTLPFNPSLLFRCPSPLVASSVCSSDLI